MIATDRSTRDQSPGGSAHGRPYTHGAQNGTQARSRALDLTRERAIYKQPALAQRAYGSAAAHGRSRDPQPSACARVKHDAHRAKEYPRARSRAPTTARRQAGGPRPRHSANRSRESPKASRAAATPRTAESHARRRPRQCCTSSTPAPPPPRCSASTTGRAFARDKSAQQHQHRTAKRCKPLPTKRQALQPAVRRTAGSHAHNHPRQPRTSSALARQPPRRSESATGWAFAQDELAHHGQHDSQAAIAQEKFAHHVADDEAKTLRRRRRAPPKNPRGRASGRQHTSDGGQADVASRWCARRMQCESLALWN